MNTVQASAPGKIILFGEHAVVYGRPAIAVPIPEVRASARLQPAQTGSGLRIVAPNLSQDYKLADAAPDDPLAAIVHNTLAYLQQPEPDLTLHLSATIPLGRGLGSGAAVSTAIVRGLAQFFEQPLAPAQISGLVFEIEKLYHGTPSGIDNSVVAFEQPVYFVKGRPLQRLQVGLPLTFVVGDTGIVSATHRPVGEVRRRWQAEPARYEGYFDEIGTIVDQARVRLERGLPGLSAFGKLMNENQELLRKLGVSSPELDRLIEAALGRGAAGAKLSGAGWGGNMIALAPPKAGAIEAVTQALQQAGAAGVIVFTLS